VMVLLSHAGDGTAEATWLWRDVDAESYWRWHCRGDLAMAQCRRWVMLAMVLPSHAGDGAAEVTWLRRDVDASHTSDGATESCWRWWCQGTMSMSSHASDDISKSCW
jgi:hypothetical protein